MHASEVAPHKLQKQTWHVRSSYATNTIKVEFESYLLRKKGLVTRSKNSQEGKEERP